MTESNWHNGEFIGKDLWPERDPLARQEPVIGQLLLAIAAEEKQISNREIELPLDCFGWMPYNIARFITYLADAVQYAPGPRFLDVGCGPGTKMIVAEGIFHLQAAGIEIVEPWVKRARERGLRVGHADARIWTGYGEADIVYVNRTVTPQEPFEQHIMEHMREGAVLVSVNGRLRASDEGWLVAAEEYADPRAPVNGVWVKP